MEHQPTSESAPSDAPRAAASIAWLQALRQVPRHAPRWTLLRRVDTNQRDDHTGEASDLEPHIVGVRDRMSGQTRIFTVYGASSGATHDAPPPDPDPPPAAPARARAPAELWDADEAVLDVWPHTLAA